MSFLEARTPQRGKAEPQTTRSGSAHGLPISTLLLRQGCGSQAKDTHCRLALRHSAPMHPPSPAVTAFPGPHRLSPTKALSLSQDRVLASAALNPSHESLPRGGRSWARGIQMLSGPSVTFGGGLGGGDPAADGAGSWGGMGGGTWIQETGERPLLSSQVQRCSEQCPSTLVQLQLRRS